MRVGRTAHDRQYDSDLRTGNVCSSRRAGPHATRLIQVVRVSSTSETVNNSNENSISNMTELYISFRTCELRQKYMGGHC